MLKKEEAAAATGPRGDGNKNAVHAPSNYNTTPKRARLVLVESRNDDGRVTGLEHHWLPLGAAVNRALGAALRARRAC